ncbi:MAG: phosphomannomutase [Gammaproteobacteria bacterium]|nr:phosphomannomutase [Gammaproteobacteria bacterium]
MKMLSSFKAYDIRGTYPQELNETLVYQIGRAFPHLLNAKKVVIGRDMRLSSESLRNALVKGLTTSGADVYDLGLSGTEQLYFATFREHMDGGIMITASHNPKEDNGLKLVRNEAIPLSSTELQTLKHFLENKTSFQKAAQNGSHSSFDIRDRYRDALLNSINEHVLKPLKIVVNAGNGMAGHVIDFIEPFLPFQFIKIHYQPDGTFPNGVPNPLLLENRTATQQAILEHQADLGIAWDGDFDRCFLFDEKGQFIEGYYLIGLLAEYFLEKEKGAKIIYDPRLIWNTHQVITQNGGIPIQNRAGHTFFKMRMRAENAIYGGEMSGHHYFRDFGFCDSGMIPWLLVTEILSSRHLPLSKLVKTFMTEYPISGEINQTVSNPLVILQHLEQHYQTEAKSIDRMDGLSIAFENWRFNVRPSNTEPLLRLNVETQKDKALLADKTQELKQLIAEYTFHD